MATKVASPIAQVASPVFSTKRPLIQPATHKCDSSQCSLRAADPFEPTELDYLNRVTSSLEKEVLQSLVAHRGFHCINDDFCRPIENTLQSMELAWANGIKLCECDIKLTSDNKIILSHDDTLQRLAMYPDSPLARRPVDEMTFEEVRQTPLKNGAYCPLLLDVLRSATRYDPECKLVVEIKTKNMRIVPALVSLLFSDLELLSRVAVIMSFHKRIMEQTASLLESALSCYQDPSIERPKMVLLVAASKSNPDYISTSARDPEQPLDEYFDFLCSGDGPSTAHLDGIYFQYQPEMTSESEWGHLLLTELVGVWGCPDCIEIVRELAEMGVAYINTDVPHGFLLEAPTAV